MDERCIVVKEIDVVRGRAGTSTSPENVHERQEGATTMSVIIFTVCIGTGLLVVLMHPSPEYFIFIDLFAMDLGWSKRRPCECFLQKWGPH